MQALPATQQRLQRPLASSLETQGRKDGHREKHISSYFFSAPLRLEAYEICRAVSAVVMPFDFLVFYGRLSRVRY